MVRSGGQKETLETPEISSCFRPGTESASLLDAIPRVQIRLDDGGQRPARDVWAPSVNRQFSPYDNGIVL
jgi:hypothetical protein